MLFLKKKSYKYNLKEILKDGRKIRNRAEFSLEDNICSLLHMYYIKREAWLYGAKLKETNGIYCRRLMDKNEGIINKMRDIFLLK